MADPLPDDHRLPAVRQSGDVLEGTVVGKADAPRAIPLRVVHGVRAVARHELTRAACRNVAYIWLGAYITAKRLYQSRSTARYEQHIRGAEAAGDHETALEWNRQRDKFLKDRHQRRTDLVELPLKVALVLPKIALGFFAVLAAIGIMLAVADKHVAALAYPFRTVADIVGWTAVAFSVSWGPFLLFAPEILLLILWWTGRVYANASQTAWSVARKSDDDAGIIITADTIVLALQHLSRITPLQKAFKDGWAPTFHTMPTRDGRGYSAVFSVPLGVTAEMIADARPVLARNVHREEVEVWPTDAAKAEAGPAGTVAIWIADRGILGKPAPEYPLLHEGTADVFAGVPAGVSPRGDALACPVAEANIVFGGMMGQGKSNGVRVVMLGAALDPLAELWVHLFAYNGDFDAFAPRLARYVKGAEREQLDAAMASLHELYADVARREQLLADLGAKKVTRDLAQKYPGLRPKVVAFSECHELFGDRDCGEEATDLAVAVVRRARKTAITTVYDTQAARKDAIPPKLVSLVSVNFCFAVKSWRDNDGFLGDGSFAAGVRATELRPGRDRGRSLATGVSDAQFELLKWHYIANDDDTGADDAAPVIARALAAVAPGTPVAGGRPVPALEARDLLADLDAVMKDERVKLRDLVGLLRGLAPAWGAYQKLTAAQLRKELAALGVRVVTTGNIPRLDPADLRRAIAERSTEDLDGE